MPPPSAPPSPPLPPPFALSWSSEAGQAFALIAIMTALFWLAVLFSRWWENHCARRFARARARRVRAQVRQSAAYELGRVMAQLELEAASPQALEGEADEAARKYLDASLYPMGGAHSAQRRAA